MPVLRLSRADRLFPADLRAMQKRGVRIYSIPNLHPEVYVFGGVAFTGSANASNHSAGAEAVIQTTDKGIMQSARQFVRGLCLDELGPERLDHLAKLYRPPRFANGVLARQFCDCLRDRVDYFIGFRGIDFV